MVTPTDPGQNVEVADPAIEDITPVEQEESLLDQDSADTLTSTEDTEVAADATAFASPSVEESVTQEPAQQTDQKSLDELAQRRSADADRQWRESLGQQARQYEQQLQESGYMPEQARDQARRFVMQEQKSREQERESTDMMNFVQGRQAAAMHFMKKHKLTNQQMLDDLAALQRANSPADMEREARRMQRERALLAENARLKQGRVAPQSFDNSQGAAEATSNQGRLLEAYLAGDRSEAAVQAAKKLTFGA